MSLEIRHYTSITDVRRTLKKIKQTIKTAVKTINANKVLKQLTANMLINNKTSKVQERIKINTKDSLSIAKQNSAAKELSDCDALLQHLMLLLNNELPDEFLVSKLKKEIVDLQNQIEQISQAIFADKSVSSTTPEFNRATKDIVAWIDTYLQNMFDVMQSKMLLTCEDQNFYFNAYFVLYDLMDKNKYFYKKYYVILRKTEGQPFELAYTYGINLPKDLLYTPTVDMLSDIKKHFKSINVI